MRSPHRTSHYAPGAASPANANLNAVCPYYTMFPLDFPLRVLKSAEGNGDWVLDPFCGRGTSNFAARLLSLPTLGIDSNPVAVAIARAKLAGAEGAEVTNVARRILKRHRGAIEAPSGPFWKLAYSRDTLRQLCMLRRALLEDCRSQSRIALRAIILGALHGPRGVSSTSYFSNQCPRTFAPKPAYATRYWEERHLQPPRVDVIDVIGKRAERYLAAQPDRVAGVVRLGDSRSGATLENPTRFSWVITSPPYYGMRTYTQDQWLRAWFLGGPPEVDYHHPKHQISHRSPEVFASELRLVWRNAASVSKASARLVCRFGGIHDRAADPLDLIRSSFQDSGWRVATIHSAGDALDGKRQATQFAGKTRKPRSEYDIYAIKS